jgi:sodium transport system permease protein
MRAKVTYTIYHKELVDMLRDRRTVISMILVPLLVIPALFSVMGIVISHAEEKSGVESRVIAVSDGLGQEFREALAKAGLTVVSKPDLKAAVQNKSAAAAVEPGASSSGGPEVRLYFDRTNQSSEMAADKVRAALADFKDERIRRSLA